MHDDLTKASVKQNQPWSLAGLAQSYEKTYRGDEICKKLSTVTRVASNTCFKNEILEEK